MDDTRRCPYCAEEIRTEAIRCRYCRSRLAVIDPERWFRDHPERRLAGVAAAVASAFAVPVGFVRLGFVVLTFIHLAGPLLYGALWLLVPFRGGDPSPFERLLAWARGVASALGGTARPRNGVSHEPDAPRSERGTAASRFDRSVPVQRDGRGAGASALPFVPVP
jgi:phage shock protein PspC (stress-responsive transcriptional regulator)